jgi:hypothetical protein
MPSKSEVPKNASIGTASGLTGKTLTAVNVWKHGSVDVVEIAHSAGTIFVKFRNGQAEFGGTADWGSGTQIY